jgi:hypothetical protein
MHLLQQIQGHQKLVFLPTIQVGMGLLGFAPQAVLSALNISC